MAPMVAAPVAAKVMWLGALGAVWLAVATAPEAPGTGEVAAMGMVVAAAAALETAMAVGGG